MLTVCVFVTSFHFLYEFLKSFLLELSIMQLKIP